MSERPLTPEELICQMSKEELMELLEEIGMESSAAMADVIKNLVRELGTLESAIEAVGGHPMMRKAA